MTLREILIELGNTGIKGTLKPNAYYNGKIDDALASIRSVLSEEIDKLKPVCKYVDHDKFCDCNPVRNRALSEAREVIERLTEPNKIPDTEYKSKW